MINISRTAAGFTATFPFELKDGFKSTFPSAKWNPKQRCWELGPRTGKRLEQWAAAAADADAALEARDAAEMSEAELHRLESDFLKVQEEIARERARQATYAASIQAIQSAGHRLVEAQSALESERQAVQEEKTSLIEQVKKIIDFSSVLTAHVAMRRTHKQVGSRASSQFREAQKTVEQELDRLYSAGFSSKGMAELVGANFNRADRDFAGDVSSDDLLVITRLAECENSNDH